MWRRELASGSQSRATLQPRGLRACHRSPSPGPSAGQGYTGSPGLLRGPPRGSGGHLLSCLLSASPATASGPGAQGLWSDPQCPPGTGTGRGPCGRLTGQCHGAQPGWPSAPAPTRDPQGHHGLGGPRPSLGLQDISAPLPQPWSSSTASAAWHQGGQVSTHEDGTAPRTWACSEAEAPLSATSPTAPATAPPTGGGRCGCARGSRPTQGSPTSATKLGLRAPPAGLSCGKAWPGGGPASPHVLGATRSGFPSRGNEARTCRSTNAVGGTRACQRPRRRRGRMQRPE